MFILKLAKFSCGVAANPEDSPLLVVLTLIAGNGINLFESVDSTISFLLISQSAPSRYNPWRYLTFLSEWTVVFVYISNISYSFLRSLIGISSILDRVWINAAKNDLGS